MGAEATSLLGNLPLLYSQGKVPRGGVWGVVLVREQGSQGAAQTWTWTTTSTETHPGRESQHKAGDVGYSSALPTTTSLRDQVLQHMRGKKAQALLVPHLLAQPGLSD